MKETQASYLSDSKKKNSFNLADLTLICLIMALIVLVTWVLLVEIPQNQIPTAEITARLKFDDVPQSADGAIKIGDLLYTEKGEAFGTVTSSAYIRPDGSKLVAYIDITVVAEDVYNGYRIGEEILTVGARLSLHTKDFGGSQALCTEIRVSS